MHDGLRGRATGITGVSTRLNTTPASGAILAGASLRACNLRGARLDSVDLQDADLRGAVLDEEHRRLARRAQARVDGDGG